MRKKTIQCVLATSLVFTLGACGTKAPLPATELSLASSAVKSAEQSGAQRLAPIELRIAREKQAAADKAVEEKNYSKARYLSVEARTDAELARAAADAQRTRLELERAQQGIELLRGDALPTSNSSSTTESE